MAFFKKWKLTTFLVKNGISRALFEKMPFLKMPFLEDFYLVKVARNAISKMPFLEHFYLVKVARNGIFEKMTLLATFTK